MLSNFYSNPALYDLIHTEGTAEELNLLTQISSRHGNTGRSALEPACGTARYLPGLLRRGWTVSGYDINPQMVAYAKKRLAKWGQRAKITKGDMTTFRPREKVDLAFNLLSTFRHLLTDKDALAHLHLTYEALNPGGIFVLGLDLATYREEPDEEIWTAQGGITHVMLTLPPDPRRRRERIINFITLPNQKGDKVLESSYDLRSYDAGQLDKLLRRTKFLRVADYGHWVVLKKKD